MGKIMIGAIARLREKKKKEERILKGKMRHERAGIHEENPEYRPLKKL